MFDRLLQALIELGLRHSPAVALLGPRQVGKTTLARAIAERHPGAMLLDLERESDRRVAATRTLLRGAPRSLADIR